MKSKYMIFSTKYINNSTLIIDNDIISRVSTLKHLRVYLASNFDWSKQIDERTRLFKFIRTKYVISWRGKEQNGAKFTIRDFFYSLTGSIKNIWEF